MYIQHILYVQDWRKSVEIGFSRMSVLMQALHKTCEEHETKPDGNAVSLKVVQALDRLSKGKCPI